MSNAFSNALALESVGELGIFNAATGTYSGVTHDDLVSYARTVAYKVFHNLKLGHTMSKEDDPLTVDGVSAANVWADHYEFVSENPLCGEWYRVPYPPTDAMKDAWNNDDSNDFNTAYLAMVHASPAADQCCGKCEKPADFAKLFSTERGQILVMLDKDSDDRPAVSFTFDPGIDSLSTCSIALGFSDNEDGEEMARKAFEATDQAGAERVVFPQIDKMRDAFGGAA